jgi:putative DNA primase/helicase
VSTALPLLDPYPDFLAELKAHRQWLCYKLQPSEKRPGKMDKIPMRADRPGQHAASTRPGEWTDYATAVNAAQTVREYAGVGYVFVEQRGIVGVDLDDCLRADGTLLDWARPIVTLLRGAYMEVSPSGSGLHIIARGTLPPGRRRRGDIEMYSTGRFFTVTGQRYHG